MNNTNKKSAFLTKADFRLAGADKKDISGSFRIDLNSCTKSRRRRAYHQNEVLYITKAKALYIIINYYGMSFRKTKGKMKVT